MNIEQVSFSIITISDNFNGYKSDGNKFDGM